MLSEKELHFLQHWELVREDEARITSKFLRGLPVALLFGLPLLFSITLVYFLSPEWYTKISQAAAGSSLPILLAVCIFILFFSFARMHFKWEMNEQLYLELKQKQKMTHAAND